MIVKRMGDVLLINVSNSYSDKSKREPGKTAKKGIHGYGLKSVEAKVKKYEGKVKWGGKNGRFVVTITFFNMVLSKGD